MTVTRNEKTKSMTDNRLVLILKEANRIRNIHEEVNDKGVDVGALGETNPN